MNVNLYPTIDISKLYSAVRNIRFLSTSIHISLPHGEDVVIIHV